MTLSAMQQKALERIGKFVQHEDGKLRVFVLKGYAGTGKTTLVKEIAKTLPGVCAFMAPTGRAAKVLRDKLAKVLRDRLHWSPRTIHSGIFSQEFIVIPDPSGDVAGDNYKIVFPLDHVIGLDYIIVDESSMIPDSPEVSDFLQFGSGRLLSDLLEFAIKSGFNSSESGHQLNVKAIIFVGDSAQLPPVTDSKSKALDVQYFEQRGLLSDSCELTEVFRQSEGSEILDAATQLRDLLQIPKEQRHTFTLDTGEEIEEIKLVDIADRYVSEFPGNKIGAGVVICYSNRKCYDINLSIRYKLYGKWNVDMQEGDLLLINNNCYDYVFGRDFYNGDIVKIRSVGRQELHKNIPVQYNGIRSHITLTFRHIEVECEDAVKARCVILENLLHSPKREILETERRALFIDFCMRMSKLGIERGSEEFKNALKTDTYFNALRVKYGYAITCHKSQGGEWEKVIVDFDGMCRLDDNALRWCYTAITRAKKKLFAVHPPHITQYTQLTFSAITNISKLPNDFFDSSIKVDSPFHGDNAMVAVKLKCRGIIEALKGTTIVLHNVEHFNWQERYTFVDNNTGSYVISAFYKSGGVFAPVRSSGGDEVEMFLCTVVNTAFDTRFECNYMPSTDVLREHYGLMQNACEELGIIIANVKEYISNYYVQYNLITDSLATIQFYMKGNRFTTAMPKSVISGNDEKLKQLILKLQ